VVQPAPGVSAKTRPVMNTLDPLWHRAFTFTAPCGLRRSGNSVVLSVIDYDGYDEADEDGDDPLGFAAGRPPRRSIRRARYDPAGTRLARPHARAERRRSSRGGALAEPSQTIHRGTRRRVRGRCERRRGDGREAGGPDSRRGVLRGCG
jgi:hypothetical protein